MQRVLKLTIPVFLTLFVFFSCKNDPQPNPPVQIAATPELDTLRLEPASSTGADTFKVAEGVVNWLGKRTIGNRHTGTVNVTSGTLTVNQGRLLSGKVTLNMASIAVNNVKDPGAKADLESHLKDSDFFEVKKFPTAEFVFQEVLPSNKPEFKWIIVGDLTMKGKTNRINIPANITVSNDELTAQSEPFVINRTLWGINFQSGVLGTVKNKIIEDIVPLSITLRAKKK